jgi:hydrogenase-4 component B
MIAVLAVIGAALLAVGALMPLRVRRLRPAMALQAAGAAAIGIAGAATFVTRTRVGAPFGAGLHPAFGIDALSGFFLVVIAVSAVPAFIFALGYVRAETAARPVVVLGGCFVLALVGVVCARGALAFLACWELMTFLPAAAVLVARPEAAVRRVVFEYLAITHVAGAGVWVTVLVLAARGPGLVHGAGLGVGLLSALWVAALVGFGCKAGLMPLHMWLPRTHPVAPAHLSALMSGVMVKVALYGLIRIMFWWASPAPQWLGIVLLAVGGISALAGVAAALVQGELKRLLAYSTIENVGVIALGLGASTVLARAGAGEWSTIALAGALLHALNHAVMKSLLFLSAGSVERATGEHDIDRLGGLLRTMPWSGTSFGVGILAIAGFPLLNGFVSEWMVLQALLHAVMRAGGGAAVASAIAAAMLGAAMALAMLGFVALGGSALLGRARSDGAAAAQEVELAMRAGVIALAAACVVLGAFPGLVVAPLVRMIPGGSALAVTPGIWIPGAGGLPTLALLVVVGGLAAALIAARGPRTAPAPVWNCGQVDEPALAWTTDGFASPVILAFRTAFRTSHAIGGDADGGVIAEVRYVADHPNLFEAHIYRPAQRLALGLAGTARRMQSGSLRAYVAYFVVVLIVLVAAARWFGG